jgi:hypothetical protein
VAGASRITADVYLRRFGSVLDLGERDRLVVGVEIL